MTRDVTRSVGAKASEIEKGVQDVRSDVAANAGKLSSEVGQVREKVS